MGAAIIDDILGIVALAIITSLADSSVNVAMVFLDYRLLYFCRSRRICASYYFPEMGERI